MPRSPVPLPAHVLSMLACPVCHGLLEQPAPETVACAQCGRRYPVRDGIPVLIAGEAQAPVS